MKAKKSRRIPVDALILTPLEIEFKAICALLEKGRVFTSGNDQRTYWRGSVIANDRSKRRVVVRKSGRGSLATLDALSAALESFVPSCLILFGTAGGLKRSQIGDVLVGNAGKAYDEGKLTPDGWRPFGLGARSDRKLLELADRVSLQDNEAWGRVHFGLIVSGEKVLATSSGPELARIRQYAPDAIGLEMEAYPFLQWADEAGLPALIVRGVSDRLGDKERANAQGSKEKSLIGAGRFLLAFLRALPRTRKSNSLLLKILGVSTALAIVSGSWWWYTDEIESQPASPPVGVASNSLLSDTKKEPDPTLDSTLRTISKDSSNTIIPKVEDPRIDRPSFQRQITEIPPTLPGPPENLGDTTSVDTIVEVSPPPPEKTYRFRLDLFGPQRRIIRQSAFEIDGRLVSAENGCILRLPAGDHTLTITLNNGKTDTVQFQVTENGQNFLFKHFN